jgi:hypothetical protein
LGVFLLFKPPADPDFGWHFKYGEYLFTHGTILKENIFSYNFVDYYWANSYWLAQAIMYLPAYFFGDTYGPLIMSLIFSVLGAVFIVKIFDHVPFKPFSLDGSSSVRLSKLGKTVGIIILFMFFSSYFVSIRPLYFSSVFMLLLLFVLLFKKPYIKFLPILFLFWANMHADFTLAGFIFTVFVLFSIVSVYKTHKKVDLTYVPTLFLAGLVTFINPFGIYLHLTLLKETHPFQFQYITEWMPLTGDIFGFVVFVSVVSLVMVSVWELKSKFGYWYAFVTIFFLVLGIRSVYFFRVGIIVGIFALAFYVDYIGLKLFNMFNQVEQRRILKSVYVVGFFIFLTGAGFFASNIYYASSIERWSKKYNYPYEAVQYLKENPIEGNMFNEYAWGGYLIWQLPEKKTFIDGRMPSWRVDDESVFEEYIKHIQSLTEGNMPVLKGEYDRGIYILTENALSNTTHLLKISDDLYIFENFNEN